MTRRKPNCRIGKVCRNSCINIDYKCSYKPRCKRAGASKSCSTMTKRELVSHLKKIGGYEDQSLETWSKDDLKSECIRQRSEGESYYPRSYPRAAPRAAPPRAAPPRAVPPRAAPRGGPGPRATAVCLDLIGDLAMLPKGTSEREVRKAYLKATLKCHPDRPGGATIDMQCLNWHRDYRLAKMGKFDWKLLGDRPDYCFRGPEP